MDFKIFRKTYNTLFGAVHKCWMFLQHLHCANVVAPDSTLLYHTIQMTPNKTFGVVPLPKNLVKFSGVAERSLECVTPHVSLIHWRTTSSKKWSRRIPNISQCTHGRHHRVSLLFRNRLYYRSHYPVIWSVPCWKANIVSLPLLRILFKFTLRQHRLSRKKTSFPHELFPRYNPARSVRVPFRRQNIVSAVQHHPWRC